MWKLQLKCTSCSIGSDLVEKQSGSVWQPQGIHESNGNCGLLGSNLQALANLLFDLKRGLEPTFSSVFFGKRDIRIMMVVMIMFVYLYTLKVDRLLLLVVICIIFHDSQHTFIFKTNPHE